MLRVRVRCSKVRGSWLVGKRVVSCGMFQERLGVWRAVRFSLLDPNPLLCQRYQRSAPAPSQNPPCRKLLMPHHSSVNSSCGISTFPTFQAAESLHILFEIENGPPTRVILRPDCRTSNRCERDYQSRVSPAPLSGVARGEFSDPRNAVPRSLLPRAHSRRYAACPGTQVEWVQHSPDLEESRSHV